MPKRRPPHTRPANIKPIRLTERDKQILETIHAFDGLLSRKQIDRLFFSGNGRTQPRQRMQALFDHGYINMPDPEEVHQVPLGEVIYWLDKKGAALVAGLSGKMPSRFSWRRQPRWSLLDHDLAVNDFRIAIRQACHNFPSLSLTSWLTDGVFRSDPDTITYMSRSGHRKTRQVIPDAFFTIERASSKKCETFAFLLEVDMATESNARFAREKARAGIAYLRSETYQKRFGLSFGRYLVVTTSDRRLQHMKLATERAGGEGLFYFVTSRQISPPGVLSKPIWQLAGRVGTACIIPAVPETLETKEAFA